MKKKYERIEYQAQTHDDQFINKMKRRIKTLKQKLNRYNNDNNVGLAQALEIAGQTNEAERCLKLYILIGNDIRKDLDNMIKKIENMPMTTLEEIQQAKEAFRKIPQCVEKVLLFRVIITREEHIKKQNV